MFPAWDLYRLTREGGGGHAAGRIADGVRSVWCIPKYH